MTHRVAVQARPSVAARFGAFVLERYPFAAAAAKSAIDALADTCGDLTSAEAIERSRAGLPQALRRALAAPPPALPETTPAISAAARWDAAVAELIDACDGFLCRAALEASLTADERREILRGMALTRATDNRLKAFFTGGDVRYGEAAFQGKGFRSLGQEAIYAAGIRLRRGEAYRHADGWRGDVVAPLIRDLGVALAMNPGSETVRLVLSAQMAKSGPPMHGRDLHVGDFASGVLPAAAPLAISTMTIAGMALAFAREGSGRVALSFIGEGGSSLGEWHEAINLCAARRLPAIFCVQNNQTALSTPVAEQSAVRVFADKAAGYGIPGLTIDGTDPDAIAAAFAWAVERARAGKGPALIELVCMRMCGHAHHDDMLYLGRDTPPAWTYAPLTDQGYANRDLYAYWSGRDPLTTYAARLVAEGLIGDGDLARIQQESDALLEREARAVIEAAWPEADEAGRGVLAGEPARARIEVLEPAVRAAVDFDPGLPALEPNAPRDPKGSTLLDAVMLGVGDALRADDRVFVFGEDVGGSYGNAFLLLKPLLKEFGARILNSPLAEGAVIGACVGAALAGQRPIGEMQFNDFVATGFNQLVNNAAKIRYRWGGSVPMVLRMPWGGLRHAGPYHSQNTEAWFYRTPGLKIVVPSTPADARALMAAAVADPDPVLYYEHIALYRDPRIKQRLGDEPPAPLPIGRAALRRAGGDLAIISYGAYVHTALSVAERLAADGIQAAVLDLRTLAPLDRAAVLAVARHCSRVLVVHEDTRTGSIGESLAAIIQEEAFESLDAPVRIIGALDTPVPYSPPLEVAFLPGEAAIERAARLLVGY
ncbi:MAG TPA: thiamine pyrophosphate-dependent enzyme [Vicinamibacterales bacterium]|nr:thiamine pyrophosphate-dependent enzyme [Vicinamibacterales bacterium]